MIKNTTTRKTFQEVMDEYKTLGTLMKNLVKNTARLELRSCGEEIGSSDVNCEIVNLYNTYGSFDGVIRYGLDLASEQLVD